ncbi:MAG: glutathione S-transferase family protein [Alphaproteobacteria bacterium]|nr:glutathione S-transferase family protein [Rhodospirillales bacterium]MCW9046205.1 glutathione S-transferase family protein [Alphaproteobacteria bacterium]
MGLLIDGKWADQWYETSQSEGRFERKESSFRNWVTADGSSGFKAEAGRYHLYVSYACPWAHRTLIFRALKGLENMIDVTVVNALMKDKGWILPDGTPFYSIYLKADTNFTGRVTVPVLWDKQTNSIVNNESSEIIRMFNTEFDGIGAKEGNYYPDSLKTEIDEVNDYVYPRVNNGVYRCGFATTQEAYEEAFGELFDGLDTLENKLANQRYLTGDQITEADWRLFTTLLRFDPVYVGHFKCNKQRLADYPNLWAYTRELYQYPGVAETVHMDHIKDHYYRSHDTINPSGVVPLGPKIEFNEPHGRNSL